MIKAYDLFTVGLRGRPPPPNTALGTTRYKYKSKTPTRTHPSDAATIQTLSTWFGSESLWEKEWTCPPHLMPSLSLSASLARSLTLCLSRPYMSFPLYTHTHPSKKWTFRLSVSPPLLVKLHGQFTHKAPITIGSQYFTGDTRLSSIL